MRKTNFSRGSLALTRLFDISSSTSGESSWGTVNEGSFFAAVFRHILTNSELFES